MALVDFILTFKFYTLERDSVQRSLLATFFHFLVVNKLPMNNNRKPNFIKVLFIYTFCWLGKGHSPISTGLPQL